MATVLIIATDQVIGGLLGQLTELSGHAAHFRRDGDEASQAVRQAGPDVVMVDAAYGRASLDGVARAAADVGAAVVYFASTMPAKELRRFALERGAKYFALPAGPKLLRQVLASALAGEPASGDDVSVSAAAAAVTRARALVARAGEIRTDTRALRAEHEAALAECRRSYAELREAVISYTRALRSAGVPPDRTIEMVRAALASDAGGAHAHGGALRDAMDDALEWCLQAYYAA
jgi:DNA-binding response OmpR family regulator